MKTMIRENDKESPVLLAAIDAGMRSLEEKGAQVTTRAELEAKVRQWALAAGAGSLQSRPVMVFAEIKPQIEKLPHDEMVKAMAYLKHLLRAMNPDYPRDLAQRHEDIAAGRGISLTEAKKRLENS